MATEKQWEETIVKSSSGGSVETEAGYGFFIGEGFENRAKPGDTIATLSHGIGSQIQGVKLNGVVLWEKSDEQVERERQEWLANYHREQAEAEERSRSEYAARLAADPLAFDWDREGPSPEAAAALDRVTDESEFPETYSGQGWRCAYRYWKATAADPDLLDGLGAYDSVPGVNVYGMGLSGFQEGWARNAVRQMRGKMPKPNPAVLEIGEFEQDPLPSRRSAAGDLKAVIG